MGNYIITQLILSKVEINMTHERIVWFSVTKLVSCPMTRYRDIVHVSLSPWHGQSQSVAGPLKIPKKRGNINRKEDSKIKQNMEISSLKQRIIALENGGTITSEHETSFGNFK